MMGQMPPVTRLLTSVEVDDDVADDHRLSVSARLEAVLADGRHLLLLDDRGWSTSGPPGVWAATTVAEVVATARVVVGPDEAFDDRTAAEMAEDHWGRLAHDLRRQGVDVDPATLAAVPHDVVLGERLRTRLGVSDGAAG